MKYLFICTGNTCRSLMAEFLFNKMAADRKLEGWEAQSVGIAAEGYFQIPPGVKRALGERGIDTVEHTAEMVGREKLRWADMIVPMTRRHEAFLLDEFPEFRDKIRLFSQLGELEDPDVADPIGQPDPVYQKCRDLLERGLETLLKNHDATKD